MERQCIPTTAIIAFISFVAGFKNSTVDLNPIRLMYTSEDPPSAWNNHLEPCLVYFLTRTSQPRYPRGMPEQAKDYFSNTLISNLSDCSATWPSRHGRNISAEHNAAMREMIQSWCPPIVTPPACEAVCFSRWTRFNTSPSKPTPIGELKASDVCKASGTASGYDPPATEWTYLGADQPVNLKENVKPKINHRKHQIPRSWATVSTLNSIEKEIEPVQFLKQQPKRVNTSSQLTMSLKLSLDEPAEKSPSTSTHQPLSEVNQTQSLYKMRLVQKLGLDGVRCDELPSAFDSDSEDETDT